MLLGNYCDVYVIKWFGNNYIFNYIRYINIDFELYDKI